MIRPANLVAVLVIGICGCSSLPTSAQTLTAFEARARSCEHWSGEDAYDAARGAEIAKAIKANRCDDLLTDGERLSAANRSSPAILARIDTAISPFR